MVWEDSEDTINDYYPYLHDFATGKTTKLSDKSGFQLFPKISGEKVVWQNRYELTLINLNAETTQDSNQTNGTTTPPALNLVERAGFPVTSYKFTFTKAADLNNDGKKELVSVFSSCTDICTMAVNGIMLWNSDGTQVWEGWPKGITTKAQPAIGDVDGDGENEIVVVDIGFPSNSQIPRPGILHVYNYDGSEAAGFPKSLYYNLDGQTLDKGFWVKGAPSIGDINGDGKNDVIIGIDHYTAGIPHNTHVFAFNGNGDPITGFPVNLQHNNEAGQGIPPTISLADLNKDGKDELVALGWPPYIHVLTGTGNYLSGWPKNIGTHNWYWEDQAVIGDINNDGTLETVVITTTGGITQVHAYNPSGNDITGFPATLSGARYPVLADFEGDGKKEIVLLSRYGLYSTLVIINNDGTIRTNTPLLVNGTNQTVNIPPVIGDLNGDNTPDILLASSSVSGNQQDYLFFYHPDGTQLRDPEPFATTGIRDVTLTDLENDGKTELILTTQAGIHVYNLQSSTAGIQWSERGGNTKNTGLLPKATSAPPITLDITILTEDLDGNERNPEASGNHVIWQETLPNQNYVRNIWLYDIGTKQKSKIIANLPYEANAKISDGKIVYEVPNDATYNYDIFVYDIAASSSKKLTLGGKTHVSPKYPSISRNKVVWNDMRNGNFDIYLYDLETNQERRITTSAANQTMPIIDGTRIIYLDDSAIKLYDLSTGQEKTIPSPGGTKIGLTFSGNKVAWSLGYTIYTYDIAAATTVKITQASDWIYPRISETQDRMVWSVFGLQSGLTANIYVYDFSTGKTEKVHTEKLNNGYNDPLPILYNNVLYWKSEILGQLDIAMTPLAKTAAPPPPTNTSTPTTPTSTPTTPSPLPTGENSPLSKPFPIATGPNDQKEPKASGKRIVYTNESINQTTNTSIYNIWLYDDTTGTRTQITNSPAYQSSPDISGDWIAWHDNRDGNFDIYAYNIVAQQEKRITTSTANQMNPSIDSNIIVWTDYRNVNGDIYSYDLTTNQEKRITTNTQLQFNPDNSEGRIVYQDHRNGNYDIYLYDLSTGTEQRITTSAFHETYPQISDNLIGWTTEVPNAGNRSIHLYDLSTNEERTLSSNLGYSPARISIHENMIVFSNSLGTFALLNYSSWTIQNVSAGYYPSVSKNLITYQVNAYGINKYDIHGIRFLDTPETPPTPQTNTTTPPTNTTLPPPQPPPEKTYAYVAGVGGLKIFDVTDPTNPQLLSTTPVGNVNNIFRGIEVIGDTAYAVGDDTFSIFDISDKTNPKLLGKKTIPGRGWALDIDGNYAFIANYDIGLQALDIRNPGSLPDPVFITSCLYAAHVLIRDDVAFITCNNDSAELKTVDVRDIAAPVELARGTTFGVGGNAVAIEGNYAYLVTNFYGGILTQFDISNIYGTPSGGTLMNSYPTIGDYSELDYAYDVKVRNGIIYVGELNGISVLRQPLNRFLNKTKISLQGNVRKIFLLGNYLYMAADYGGLQIFDIKNAEYPTIVGNAKYDSAWDVFVTTTSTIACGDNTCNTGEETSCPLDCATTGKKNYYYSLNGDNCTLQLNVTTENPAKIHYNDNPFICTDSFDHTILVEGARDIDINDLSEGDYTIQIETTGKYTLTASAYCAIDKAVPEIDTSNIPSGANAPTNLQVLVRSQFQGLQTNCQVCFGQDTCNWETAGIDYETGAKAGNCSYFWNTTDYPDGNYTISFRVSDLIDRITEMTPATIILDKTPPEGFISQITNPVEIGKIFTFTVTANDESGDVTIKAVLNNNTQNTTIALNKTTDGYVGIALAPIFPGNYPLIVEVNDLGGNTITIIENLRVNGKIDLSEPLSIVLEPSTNQAAATDTQGNTIIAYQETTEGNEAIYISKISKTGELLTYKKRLATGLFNTINPTLATDSQNNIHIAWTDDRDNNKEIYYSKLSADGAFLVENKRLTTNTFASEKPVLTLAGNNIYLTHIDDRNGAKQAHVRLLDLQGNTIQQDITLPTPNIDTLSTGFVGNLYIAVGTNDGKIFLNKITGIDVTTIEAQAGNRPTLSTGANIHLASESNGIMYTSYDTALTSRYTKTIAITGTNPHIATDDNTHISWEQDGIIKYSRIDANGNNIISEYTISPTTGDTPFILLNPARIIWNDDSNVLMRTTNTLEKISPTISNVKINEVDTTSAKVTWTTNEYATSSVQGTTDMTEGNFGKEHTVFLRNLTPNTNYSISITSKDIAGNEAVDNNKGKLYTFLTEISRFKPELPTTVYGSVVFADNASPAPGMNVTATWTDNAGKIQKTTTISLTKEEAELLNDPNLEGFFLFNRGDIQAKTGTTITVAAPNDANEPDPYVLANPGGKAELIIGGPLRIDVTPPLIELIKPQEITYTSLNIPLKYTTDEDISKATYSLNGQNTIDITQHIGKEISIQARVGINTLSLTVTDLLGLTSDKTVTFFVNDTQPPNVSVNMPLSAKGDILLNAIVIDPTNELSSSCEVCIASDMTCDTEWVRAKDNFKPGEYQGTCEYTWMSALTPDSTYLVNFRIKDATGNQGTGTGQTITIDNTPPSLPELTITPVPKETSLILEWTSISDADTYTLYRSDQAFSDTSKAAKILTLKTTSYKDQGLQSSSTYHYAITATDINGNERTSVTSQAGTTTDTTPPIITINEPQQKTYNQTNLSLIYTTDEDASCTIQINGGPTNTPPQTIGGIEGKNTLIMTCTDSGENKGTASITYSIDTTPPGQVQNLAISPQAGTSNLRLTWTKPADTDVSEYLIYRAENTFSTANDAQLIGQTSTTSFTDLGLVSEKTYHYGIIATDQAGNINPTLVSKAGTVADITPPIAISNIQVQTVPDERSIKISWKTASDADFDHYNIYRSASPKILLTTITKKTTRDYTDLTAESGITYTYYVTAVDTSGNEIAEPQGSTITANDLDGPIITINSPEQKKYNTQNILIAYTANEAISSCSLSLDGTNEPFTETITAQEGSHTLSLTCTDLAGNLATKSTNFTIDTTPPQPITGFTVSASTTETKAILSWNPSPANDFFIYRIYRQEQPFQDVTGMQPFREISTTAYSDADVISEKTYYYAIVAIDDAKNQIYQVTSVPVTIADFLPPPKVQDLIVEQTPGENSLTLTFSGGNVPDFKEFRIYRQDRPFDYAGTPIATTHTTAYTDSGLTSQKTYHYAVTAIDTNGNEDRSVVSVQGTVADTIPPKVSITTPLPSGYASTTIALQVNIDEETTVCTYSLDNNQYEQLTSEITATEGTHTLLVQCRDTAGNIGTTTPVNFYIDITPPTQVKNIIVNPVKAEPTLQLQWEPVGGSYLYKIYRAQNPFTSITGMTPIANINATAYKDTGLQSSKTYHYAVTAIDQLGNQDPQVTSVQGQVADVTPPVITITSPIQKLYGENTIPLTYTANEESTCTYILNNKPAQQIPESITADEGKNTLTISCTDQEGNTGSKQVLFEVDTAPPPAISGLTITPISRQNALSLTWNPSPAQDLLEYHIYRASESFTSVDRKIPLATTTQGAYTDSDVLSEQTYHYAVTAVDTYSQENKEVNSKSATVADTNPPPPVTGLQIMAAENQARLDLTWNPVDANDLDHYNIYRSTTYFIDAKQANKISESKQTTYGDQTVLEGKMYYYAVTSVDHSGNEHTFVNVTNTSSRDITPPDVIVHDLGSKISGQVTIVGTGTDQGSGLMECEFCITSDGHCDTEWILGNAEYTNGDTNGICTYAWDTQSGDIGTYTYRVRFADVAGNIRESQERTVEVFSGGTLTSIDIPLRKGWNLISLPIIPQESTTEDVVNSIQGNYDRIYYYDAATSAWDVYNPRPTIFDSPNTLLTLSQGRAYWILVTTDSTLHFSGYENPTITYTLKEGFNFIGPARTIPATDAFAPIKDNIYRVYSYDTELQKWDMYKPYATEIEPSTILDLIPGQGYIIDTTYEISWQP
ncbi:MAG: FG-GAP-like repeat-containing protein [Nanoarchaeota archaeon]